MSISLETLKEAVQIKENIASLESKLAKLLAGVGGAIVGLAEAIEPKARRGRKKMSATARAKIAAAQKLRWSKQKGVATEAPTAKSAKKKRKLSAEGRAKIIAAQKKRWAQAKKK